ncbi:hypothetical protein N7495_000101 [Penicillium taxi]|uniref:uncharacterized protein n=1 Tax=Penicillium taxi TaxID=168475 RepID=UPI002544E84D|nr:uncharacterized protein N7495_000101 [Penicillium taxi]KAJ5907419.1 hypothetical protein N7495_000101 [Penicillium taxi]
MGRQAYLNRLALGRSPYEPPERAVIGISDVHADNYSQQYDVRGHPVNPESKALGRELRRAKNDILSTMGIVVSGEDRTASKSDEQEKINQIAAENDFGLVITTLDQIFVFFGTWWTSSLTARIMTYKHYTHAALLNVIRSERGATGLLGFYCAGIPAWALSSSLAIARDNPPRRLFITLRDYILGFTGSGSLFRGVRLSLNLTYQMARNVMLLLSLETYMYSLLQTLSLVPSNAFPSIRLAIPFSEQSLVQLPTLPNDFSIPSVGGYLLRLLASPGVLAFLYAFYLRPGLEDRLYRLIRRQLPKPPRADDLSVRVVFEENLVEWVVPTLGRRSEEETRRAKLTWLEDIKQEFVVFRGWVLSAFGLFSKQLTDQEATEALDQERMDNLRDTIESLQHELDEVQLRHNLTMVEPSASLARPLGDITHANSVVHLPRSLPAIAEAAQMAEAGLNNINQVLTNENRMAQSPGEMSSDFSDMAMLGRTSAPSSSSIAPNQSSNPPQDGSLTRTRQGSRSNTLFSRPSSPETSPPTSPRVRASLIHQSSDIITMQLELLGNRTRNAQGLPTSPLSRLSGSRWGSTVDRRSIAEFLEALILNQAQNQSAQQQPPLIESENGPIRNAASFIAAQEGSTSESRPQNPTQESVDNRPDPISPHENAFGTTTTILPDGIEEATDEESDIELPLVDLTQTTGLPSEAVVPAPSNVQSRPLARRSSGFHVTHRVTLLSAHPVDSLASHLAAFISGIILSPIESLLLRSLAHSYLALHHSPNAQFSDLRPIGLWFGGGSWSDVFAYTGRMVLMRGMQVALRAGVWGFLVGSTMRIGRRFCSWGSL